MGELGLGPTEKDRNVKRPRLNVHLSPEAMGRGEGVVDVAVGGMHVAALDREGKVWTWGVNDQGSLGRDTKNVVGNGDVVMKEGEGSDDDEEELLSVLESKPGIVQGFPDGVKVVELACGDSISVAIADDGLVYSWGTFRVDTLHSQATSLRATSNLVFAGVRWFTRLLEILTGITLSHSHRRLPPLYSRPSRLRNRSRPRPQHNRKSLRLGKRPTIPNGQTRHRTIPHKRSHPTSPRTH